MKRSIIAVLAGYVTMVVAVGIGLALLLVAFGDGFAPPEEPRPFDGPAYILVLEVVVSALAALAGGYVCAWIARRNELAHALGLLGLMVPLSVLSAVGEAGLKPLWSSIAVALVGVGGVVLGALLRRRHREYDALSRR